MKTDSNSDDLPTRAVFAFSLKKTVALAWIPHSDLKNDIVSKSKFDFVMKVGVPLQLFSLRDNTMKQNERRDKISSNIMTSFNITFTYKLERLILKSCSLPSKKKYQRNQRNQRKNDGDNSQTLR